MLELKNIYKTFNPGTINEKVALNGLNLTLNEGDFVTVIGGNGAGKSTMLNAVAGTWQVDEGQIIIDGIDVTKLSEHKRATYLGRVFQDPMTGTAATMGIEENLALAKRRGKTRLLKPGITKKEREEYKELLKVLGLGLENRLTSKVGLLSGGQRQALTLLMATMVPPDLLLLDEHTAALDPGTADKVLKLTQEIIEKNHTTCLMVTHNMQQALSMGNRTLMMDDGKIVLDVEGKERENMTVTDLSEVGGGKHLRLRLSGHGYHFNGIFFSTTARLAAVALGDVVDIAYTPQVNEYRGLRTVQLNLLDIRPNEQARSRLKEGKALYRRHMQGQALSQEDLEHLIPSRQDFVAVWKYLAASAQNGVVCEEFGCLARKITRFAGYACGGSKIRVCLDVFQEQGLLKMEQRPKVLVIHLTSDGKKVDLEQSPTLQHLKERLKAGI